MVGTALGLVGLGVLLGVVGYVTTKVPSPSALVREQTSVITAADGRTVLGTVGALNRIDVPLDRVSLPARRAVLAAEDRHFYSEPGISVPGILRAAWADLRGGGVQQGGSTITQQYAKNAFLTQARTWSRKIREVFIALKLGQTQSKDRILDEYLNTIYFGRGAYGIETAAEAYFGVHAAQLDAAQGAVLAAAIRGPSLYDPAIDRPLAVARWHYVVDGMVTQHWLTAAQAAAMSYPAVRPPATGSYLSGPNGFLVELARQELAAHGFDEQRLTLGGYRVVTTIVPRDQRAMVAAERGVLGVRNEPVSGMAAVQPGTGAILALYGGRDYTGRQPAAELDLATAIRRQPGSSFKPYTLATALSRHIGLGTTFDGASPMNVPGWPAADEPVHNDSNEQCPYCDLTTATARSINTVYAQLVLKVGPANVARTAHAAGITSPLHDPGSTNVSPSITLGAYPVSPLEQADGYATFAAGGVRAPAHIIAKVVDPSGHVVYSAGTQRTRAFSPAVAADATYAMQQVVAYGTGTQAQLAGGRPAAGKTGTTNNNTDAWFCGFTPQVAAAVWIGNLGNQPLTNVAGYQLQGVYGGTLPAEIWKRFMDAALAGTPSRAFPPPVPIAAAPTGVRSPTPAPSTTSATPSPAGSPTGSPAPTGPARSPTSPAPSPSGSTPPTHSPSPTRSPAPAPSRTTRSPAPPPAARPAAGPATGPPGVPRGSMRR